MELADLDLGYLAQFVGARINQLVVNNVRAAGHVELRQSHGYVVQHLVEGPKYITQLAELLGVSQQAASKSVAELVELGDATSTVSADRRAREVALSAKGKAAVAQTRKIRAKLEQGLRASHRHELARAKHLLAAVLEELGGADEVRARKVREPR
ncbi:MarR family transcriptional regulator [soil metagenome]